MSIFYFTDINLKKVYSTKKKVGNKIKKKSIINNEFKVLKPSVLSIAFLLHYISDEHQITDGGKTP